MKKVRVIIAGSRDIPILYDEFEEHVSDILSNISKEVEIVSGTARGVDQMGERYAKEHGAPIKQFPADWDTHGRSAGYIRNAKMAEYADILIAIWDGKSKGTSHMIDLANKNELEVFIVTV